MDTKKELKQSLYEACKRSISERIQNIQNRFRSIEEARNNESKSSVGDKHETGRAMMQLEEETISIQLSQASKINNDLERVDWERTNRGVVDLGSLVITDKANYFIAIGIGKIKLDGQNYFCISMEAPIGKCLFHKSVGDKITFNGKEICIKAIY